MAETSPPPRRFQAVPIEETVKKVRRFAPEPVETTTRSSKKDSEQDSNGTTVEKKEPAGRRRFVPTPVETSFKSSKLRPGNLLPSPEPTPTSIPRSPPPAEAPKPRRRFTPELIETTKRSKRAGDVRPATLPTDKTDLTPGVPNIYTRPSIRNKHLTVPPEGSLSPIIPPLPPRRQPSMRPHPNSRRSTRQSSFHPELEDIKSEENSSQDSSDEEGRSGGDSPPSLSDSIRSSEDSLMRLQLARTRESCDERFSGYLLELAAKAAEKQLKEQALAAFPNESLHQLVEHFYDRETSDDESVEGIGMLIDEPTMPEIRRKSTEVGWAVKEMQQHQEKLNRQREEETNKKIAAEASNPTFRDPFWTNGKTDKSPFSPFTHVQAPSNDKEAELRCMRSAASPPMLGGDLKFRMCPSPKATKFESDQRRDIQPNRSENGGGLWGGYCVTAEAGEYLSPAIVRGPNLIHTPNVEHEDPFSSAFACELPASGAKTPRSPRDSGVRMLAGLDERLKAEVARSKVEDALLQEFDDVFVTQVYNYLSLGYPSLARQYDEELARISRISEDELRSDDAKKNAKGYINIQDPFASQNTTPEKKNAENKGYCARWKALRIYILEWARQHPNLSEGGATPNAWGVRARRGSWAI